MIMKWNVGWGITSACNMNCEFCYSKKVRSHTADLPIADCYKFVDENYMYINSINYGTGENSLIEQWYSFVDYVKSTYGLPQALTTNGYVSCAITSSKEKYQKFIRSIDEVDVSIDYIDESKHCNLRGNPNVYKWAIDSLRVCQEEGLTSTIVFVGMKDNLTKENIDGLFSLADKYNAKLRMNLYRPTIGVNEQSLKYIPTFEQIVDMLQYINDTYKVLSIDDSLFGSLFVDGFEGKDPSGTTSLRILPNGSITPSTYLITSNFVIENIKTKDVLQNITPQFKDINCADCESCKFYKTCQSGVIDRRYLWYGTGNMPDPYCPVKNELPIPDFKIRLKREQNNDVDSIHHGYLPTMFFKP